MLNSDDAADDIGGLLQARIASQAVCVGNYIWLIGGWDPGSKGDGGEILNDIWRLDLSTWTWTDTSVQVKDSYSTLNAVLASEAAWLHSCQHYSTMWYCQICTHAQNVHCMSFPSHVGTILCSSLHRVLFRQPASAITCVRMWPKDMGTCKTLCIA